MDVPPPAPGSSPHAQPTVRGASRWRSVWRVLQWVLFAAVLGAVAYRGWGLWHDVGTQNVAIHYGWLAAAVVLYIAAWTPAWIYWRALLSAVGDEIPPLQIARAYYCGHLGKYIPGKAGVIVIRAAMISRAGGNLIRAALTAGYESLTTIGTGAAVALMFSPWMFTGLIERPGWNWLTSLPGYPYAVPVVVIAVCLAALPIVARLFARLAGKAGGTAAVAAEDSAAPQPGETVIVSGISTRLLFSGSVLLVLGWCVHGLALGCIIRGSGGASFHLADWPLWTAAIAAAICGGFVAVFAPAGLGVREFLLVEALQSHIGPQQAVAVAVLLRLVSLVGELTAAAGLWKFGPQKQGADA